MRMELWDGMKMEPRCCPADSAVVAGSSLWGRSQVSDGRRSRDVLAQLLPSCALLSGCREQHWGAQAALTASPCPHRTIPAAFGGCRWAAHVGTVQVPRHPPSPLPAWSCPAPPVPMGRPKDVTKGKASVLLGLPAGRLIYLCIKGTFRQEK